MWDGPNAWQYSQCSACMCDTDAMIAEVNLVFYLFMLANGGDAKSCYKIEGIIMKTTICSSHYYSIASLHHMHQLCADEWVVSQTQCQWQPARQYHQVLYEVLPLDPRSLEV